MGSSSALVKHLAKLQIINNHHLSKIGTTIPKAGLNPLMIGIFVTCRDFPRKPFSTHWSTYFRKGAL